MTEPQPGGPYSSDIRGDNPNGLGGAWRLLKSIADGIGSIPTIVERLTEIRDDLRRLSGTGAVLPAGYTNLPAYLNQVLARPSEAGPFSTTMYAWLQANAQAVQRTSGWLTGSSSVFVPGQGDLIAADIEESRDHLNAIRGFSNEQSSVLGFIGDAPAGKSIKALLEEDRAANVRAADCCEGGGEEPADPPTNERPSPETRCAVELGVLRASNLVAFADANVAPDQLYMVEFAPISGVSAGRFQNGTGNYTGGVTDLPIVVADVDMSVCVEWNYTNADNPAQATFYRFNPANLIGSGTNTLITTQTDDQNSTQVFAIPAGEAFAFSIRVLQGNQVPGLNLWVAWDEPA